ncbi:MAG TPA: hypothetical protein VL503_11080 [Candidatus Omnitrophota bacterium]|jgi:hypothetical protein|nr:hypothetical protein [Candidatus Eisenbacteria bacterium]HEU4765546.1 hypothetical protein [Candidatus Eisenbacteria bacterium]HTM01653.1 hypothetical protein [Candidatus Omnitrophota bacterium]
MRTVKAPREPENEEWLVRGEEVTALFDCALRYVGEGNRSVAERSVLELMRCLNSGGRGAGARVLAHFDACLAQLERGDFDDAFENLLMLKDSWVEALAELRRDRTRASNVN